MLLYLISPTKQAEEFFNYHIIVYMIVDLIIKSKGWASLEYGCLLE